MENSYTILLQGRIEPKAMDFWVNNLSDSKIVVSVWEDDIEYDFPQNWTIIKNKKPKERIGYKNFDLQLISTINGLNSINTKYVIKMRCDEYWSNVNEIIKMIEDDDRIICGSLFFRPVGMHPFHISDHILAGKLSNLKLMFESAYNNLLNNFWNFPIPECQLGIAYLWNKEDSIKEIIKDINIYSNFAPTQLESFNEMDAKLKIQKELNIIKSFSERIYNDMKFTNPNWKKVKEWIKQIEYGLYHMNHSLQKSEYPNIDELSLLKKYFKIIDVDLLKPYLCTCTINHLGDRAWYESEISEFDKKYCITNL